MKSSATRTQFTSLNHDALREIALRLPIGKSKAPWRDLSSLASTCKSLSLWNRDRVKPELAHEWKKARDIISGTAYAHTGLKKILDVPEGSAGRLFREPVLRLLSRKMRRDHRDNKVIRGYPDFLVTLYGHREAAELKEIKHCFTVLTGASRQKKVGFNKVLPSLLAALNGKKRVRALRLMFKWLDTDKSARRAVRHSVVFELIQKIFDEDETAKAALELGLHARGLLSYHLDRYGAGYSLQSVPDKQRWKWVARNVPEFLDTTLGLQVLLGDVSCQRRLMAHLRSYFSSSSVDKDSFEKCARVLSLHQQIAQVADGEGLIRSAYAWLKKASESIALDEGKADKAYLEALQNCLSVADRYLEGGAKEFLRAKLYSLVGAALKLRDYDRSSRTLLAIAKSDPNMSTSVAELAPASVWGSDHIEQALQHALVCAYSLSGVSEKSNYLHALMNIADLAPAMKRRKRKEFKAECLAVIRNPQTSSAASISFPHQDNDDGSES